VVYTPASNPGYTGSNPVRATTKNYMKPVKKTKEFYDLSEIEDYIVEKYNCEKEKEITWDYMCNNLNVGNNSFSYIPTKLVNIFTNAVKEEFGENPEVHISW
jgi:hypothetical protein